MRGMSENEGGCHIASVTIPSLSPDLSASYLHFTLLNARVTHHSGDLVAKSSLPARINQL